MASTATTIAPASPAETMTRAQRRQRARGRRDVRLADPPPRPQPTPMLPVGDVADPVAILALMRAARSSGQVRPERWRLVAVVHRLLLAQARSDRSSTIRVGTHQFDARRLLPAMRRDPATDRETHHEHVRRALVELEAAHLVQLTVVHDSEDQEAATDVQLLPCPVISDRDIAGSTSTITRWYAHYPAGWRRPLQPARGRWKKRPRRVVVDANVPPGKPGPPLAEEEIPGGFPPCTRRIPSNSSSSQASQTVEGRFLGNAGAREQIDTAATPLFDVVGENAAVARHRESATSGSNVLGALFGESSPVDPNQLPMTSSKLVSGEGCGSSSVLGPVTGRLTPSAPGPGVNGLPTAEIERDAPGDGASSEREAIRRAIEASLASAAAPPPDGLSIAEVDQEAPRVPDLGELLPAPLLDDVHQILAAARMLGWRVEPDGSDGLGRLSPAHRIRLDRDLRAWPTLRRRLAGWEDVDAYDALLDLARRAAVAGQANGSPTGRGVWPDGWLAEYERRHIRARVPLTILAREFHRLCQDARRRRRHERLHSPTLDRVQRAVAERPGWLSRRPDADDPRLVWTSFAHGEVQCDRIPEPDELAADSRRVAALWAALHGAVPPTAYLLDPVTGDRAVLGLRPALRGENEPPREPVVLRRKP